MKSQVDREEKEKMKTLNVRITFIEEVLGTAPNKEDLYREFIASKSPDATSIEDEVAAIGVDETAERGKTVFAHDEDDRPFLWDYQVKGFFKDACGGLARVKSAKKGELGYESAKIKAYKKVIDRTIFVYPRKIPIIFNGSTDDCQRPLRGQTALGERIALANSETVPAGAYIDINIECLSNEHEAAVREWLNYGEKSGVGQWRNSGKGRFAWEEIV